MALARRDFLKLSLATAAAPIGAHLVARNASAQPKPTPGADKLTAYQDGPQIWIRWANQLLTSYRAHPTQKYPYLYPLAGPVTGLSLTSESSTPYPHHRSLLFACDRVNGGNYWQGPVAGGQIVSTELKLGQCTPESAEILDRCEWRKPGQKPVMTDQRKFLIRVINPGLRTIDVDIQWTAVEPVTIEKTNHSLFALRAAHDITPWGGGTLFSSEGKSGEKDTFGRPAAWCTFYGKRQGIASESTEGIALMDHGKNPWKDCPWFTRDYGFISPSGLNFQDKPWKLEAGKTIQLAYRVVLYAGTPRDASLQELWQAWVED